MDILEHHIKPLRSAIIGLFIALLLSVSAFAIIVKKNSNDLYTKDLKISALISEVGNLRNELEQKSRSYRNLSRIVDTMTSQLNTVIRFADVQAKKDTSWQQISATLGKQQVQMAALLTEKEDIINDLVFKNEILKQEKKIPDVSDEVTGILILGQNSGLMDTIIVACANPKTGQITIFSIPRDLYYKGRKINELYSLYGINELKKAVGEITGITPEKYVAFDFVSFRDIVDGIGGIEVDVPASFTDNAYPGPNRSYITVSFQKGIQTMNGERALMYARSRKSSSDFERSKRQQQILDAVRKKVQEGNLIEKIDSSIKLYSNVKEHIATDISFFEALAYAEKYGKYSLEAGNVISTQNYLYSTRNEKGQYILLPYNNSYAKIKAFVNDLVTT